MFGPGVSDAAFPGADQLPQKGWPEANRSSLIFCARPFAACLALVPDSKGQRTRNETCLLAGKPTSPAIRQTRDR